MKVTDIVINKINRFKSGYVFTYDDFDLPVNKIQALKKILSRLVASGKIARLAKGQFYKPEDSIFGMLRPTEYQVVKDLLEEENKIIGYLTGLSIYNRLSLTTQVSNTIQIGTNKERKTKTRGKYRIRFIRQKNTITKENIPLLQILDSIRFIKRIPDADVTNSCKRIISILKELNETDRLSIAKYALKYNPGTRALTGAMLEQIDGSLITEPLYRSLNPATVFEFKISKEFILENDKWRIQ
ncbi:MAG: hypothetical protein KAS71_06635 [Bacteroidales bacterium]|nr:hypothetical protein [Bacteroidales bacterium]